MNRFVALIFAFLFLGATAHAQGIINTVAGGGPNNVPALTANLDEPTAVALDDDGNRYIAAGNRVFKVDAAGQLAVVAGNGFPGFSGDGGPASSAGLNMPTDLALDRNGNLYIADYANNRVRRVDGRTGIITTVAGTGTFGFSGDGGPATSANLAFPAGVTVDRHGNLYIADSANARIVRVDARTGIITTVAGNGTAGYGGDGGPATSALLRRPLGVAVNRRGDLYIADSYNFRIRVVNAATGIITTFAGTGTPGFLGDGGPAVSASLSTPYGVALGGNGDLYIADTFNDSIRRVDAAGIITTVAGNGMKGFSGDGGPATAAQLYEPYGVAVSSHGNLYIPDHGNNRVRRVDAGTGIITTVAGNGSATFSGEGVRATLASLAFPYDAILDRRGNLYIADTQNARIRRVDAKTGIITTVAGNGTAGFSGDGGPATSASLNLPTGIAFDAGGNLYIADVSNERIRRVDAATGIITTVAGTGSAGFSGNGGPATSAQLDVPLGLAFDGSGNLYIADAGNSRIRKVDLNGIITAVAGNGTQGYGGDGGPATSAQLNFAVDVAFDGSGNLYIADEGNQRIRKVDVNGIITTVAGNGSEGFSGDGGPATAAQLNFPFDVAFDGSGNMYIDDSANNRIRKVDTHGIISTYAGNGILGFSGDGGPATAAALALPAGILVDRNGNLFIADAFNNRIREVTAPECRNGHDHDQHCQDNHEHDHHDHDHHEDRHDPHDKDDHDHH